MIKLQRGWTLDEDIPDVVPEYRLPLLHWACSLGAVMVSKCMTNYLVDYLLLPVRKCRKMARSTGLPNGVWLLMNAYVDFSFFIKVNVVCSGCIAAAMLLCHLNASSIQKAEDEHQSTALHCALRSLPSAVAFDASRKFSCLVPILSQAIFVADKDGNTPFHMCCRALGECLSPYDFYCHCLDSIIVYAEESGRTQLYHEP